MQIAAGEFGACARRRSGAIACFAGHLPPTAVPTIDDAIDLATGTYASCAVRADRTVWCWGPSNARVMLGSPKTKGVVRGPMQIAGLANVAAVSLGDDHACVLGADRSVWCWGDNALGQLGDGTSTARDRPTLVPGLANVVQVSAGTHHTCALLDAGTVACWGSTSQGEVGTYRTENVAPPSAVVW